MSMLRCRRQRCTSRGVSFLRVAAGFQPQAVMTCLRLRGNIWGFIFRSFLWRDGTNKYYFKEFRNSTLPLTVSSTLKIYPSSTLPLYRKNCQKLGLVEPGEWNLQLTFNFGKKGTHRVRLFTQLLHHVYVCKYQSPTYIYDTTQIL